MTAIPWRLIAGAVAIGLLVWGGIWLAGRVRVSYQAELERDQAIEQHAAYREAVQGIAERAAARMQLDAIADSQTAQEIETLEAERARLAAAASRIPATVERPDANGVTRPAINPDRWLCVSNFVVRDAAVTAACEARAGASSVPSTVRR